MRLRLKAYVVATILSFLAVAHLAPAHASQDQASASSAYQQAARAEAQASQAFSNATQSFDNAIANQVQIKLLFQQNQATQSQLDQASAVVTNAQSTLSASQQALQTAIIQLQLQINKQNAAATNTGSLQPLSPSQQQAGCFPIGFCSGNCNGPYDPTTKLVIKTICPGGPQATTATQQGSSSAPGSPVETPRVYFAH